MENLETVHADTVNRPLIKAQTLAGERTVSIVTMVGTVPCPWVKMNPDTTLAILSLKF